MPQRSARRGLAPRSLAGKVVFITRAARGIGRATAAALVAEGARVAIGDLDEDLAKRTAKELGGEVFAIRLDGTDTREAIKRMKPRGCGHIVNLASMAGVVPTSGAATYCASKHAVVGLCESLYWELRGTGVDLSYVLPSLVKTELAAGVKNTRASNAIEPEVVAGEIISTLKKPRLAVFAPRSMGKITKVTGLIPRALGNKIMTASGSDHLLLDSQTTAGRAAYEARVAGSAPGADARRA